MGDGGREMSSLMRSGMLLIKRKIRFLYMFFFLLITITSMSTCADAEEMVRSSSLQMVIKKEGNIERRDYIDDEGVITYAADKHYATVIKTSDDKTLLEEFFDASGAPAQQVLGNYALIREFNSDGRNYKIIYLGIDGEPVLTTMGYAILIRSFNEGGDTEVELYYDTEGRPVETSLVGYGCLKEYDEIGRNIRITYLNENNQPAICGQGFASMCRSYYETGPAAGQVKTEFYYDENRKPIKLSLGQYGIYKEYDELGRCVLQTYLDETGRPMVTNQGHSSVRRTFYEDDTVKTETYYDINGKPVRLREGQYGSIRRDGIVTYLDAKWNKMFNLRNFLVGNRLSVIVLCSLIVVFSGLCNRNANYVLLILYMLFIGYMTLLNRESVVSKLNFELFWSYRYFFVNSDFRWEVLNNYLLFIPLGTILYHVYPDRKALLIPVVYSVIIETIQYFMGIGLCELDDVISNGLGAVLGFGAGLFLNRLPAWKEIASGIGSSKKDH